MKVYISAPREKRFFINCIKEVVAKRGDKWFYPPDEARDLDDKQILEKVTRELVLSNLVLMDVSMRVFNGQCYPNSGVMIEFGLLMNDRTKGLDYAYLFCDETTERNDLPPMIPRIEVEQYLDKKENEEDFKKVILQRVEDFERKAPDRLQKALGEKHALEELHLRSKTEYSTTKP